MKRGITGLACLLLASVWPVLGMAASPMNSLRDRAVDDPHSLITDVRQQLDRSARL